MCLGETDTFTPVKHLATLRLKPPPEGLLAILIHFECFLGAFRWPSDPRKTHEATHEVQMGS